MKADTINNVKNNISTTSTTSNLPITLQPGQKIALEGGITITNNSADPINITEFRQLSNGAYRISINGNHGMPEGPGFTLSTNISANTSYKFAFHMVGPDLTPVKNPSNQDSARGSAKQSERALKNLGNLA